MAGWMSSATIVAALTKHKDLQLVLSLGDQLDPNQLGPVPNNAIIVKRAPEYPDRIKGRFPRNNREWAGAT
jgi:hypothetical protein